MGGGLPKEPPKIKNPPPEGVDSLFSDIGPGARHRGLPVGPVYISFESRTLN